MPSQRGSECLCSMSLSALMRSGWRKLVKKRRCSADLSTGRGRLNSLEVAVFAGRNELIEAAHFQVHGHGLSALVLQIPSVYALKRGDERAARFDAGLLVVLGDFRFLTFRPRP